MSDLRIARVAPAPGDDAAKEHEKVLDGQLLALVMDINPNQPFFSKNPKALVAV